MKREWETSERVNMTGALEDSSVQNYLESQISLATFLGADEESARTQQTKALEFEIMLAKVEHPL